MRLSRVLLVSLAPFAFVAVCRYCSVEADRQKKPDILAIVEQAAASGDVYRLYYERYPEDGCAAIFAYKSADARYTVWFDTGNTLPRRGLWIRVERLQNGAWRATDEIGDPRIDGRPLYWRRGDVTHSWENGCGSSCELQDYAAQREAEVLEALRPRLR